MFTSPLKLIHTKLALILDLLIPRRCLGCHQENESWCRSCQEKSFAYGAHCIWCGHRNNTGAVCPSHRKEALFPHRGKNNIKQILWAGRYREEIKKAILDLKYKGRRELAKPLGQMLARKFKEFYPDIGSFLIIPVPLHFKKEHSRGFNQAELLAEQFSKDIGIPLETKILEKIKETKAQVETADKKSRINNLENAFLANKNLLMAYGAEHKTIILIDDVATTGATLFHASSALTKVGATKIICLVVAHG